jgi:ubiquinone/menaquinone biosynthesis C-methylase UbiE
VWTQYIEASPDFPFLTRKWEKDMTDCFQRVLRNKQVDHVLEVGCSKGTWLRWFQKTFGSECFGLDINPVGFSRDMHFTHGDAFRLPYKKGSFDVVLSVGLVEHFSKQERHRLLAEQYRLLSEHGVLFCQMPNVQLFSLEYYRIKYFYDFRRGYHHEIVEPKEIVNVLKSFGLKVSFEFQGQFFDKEVSERLKHILGERLLSQSVMIVAER